MRRLAAALAAALTLGTAAHAGAYCRSASCPRPDSDSTDGHVCEPASFDDCGTVLQWRQPCLGFSVQADASSQFDADTARAVLAQVFSTWTTVDCGVGPPSISVFDLGTVSCAGVEYNQHAGNANVLVFRDDGWPHEGVVGGDGTLALTTVTYDIDTGDIYDADIEVNTAAQRFSIADQPGNDEYDLISVLTHEAGHFLGLAHTNLDTPTTMSPSLLPGGTDLRILTADDQQAICAAYPPDRTAQGACTAIPRHGFAPECESRQDYVRCSAGPRPETAGLTAAAFLAAAALLTARRGTRRS